MKTTTTTKYATMKIQKLLLLLFVSYTWLANAQFLNTQKEFVDVLSYSFHIQIADKTDKIVAKTFVKFQLKKKVDSVFLQLKNRNEKGKGMEVSSLVNSSGKAMRYTHLRDQLVIYNDGTWEENALVLIEITYSGIPEDGLYIKKSKYGKKTFFGDNWPNRARYWLPVIDHPSDKALVEFHIVAPDHYKVVASGRLISEEAQEFGFTYHHFKTNQPLPTKVMVLGAADFKIKELAIVNDIVVSSWIYSEAPDLGFDDYKPAVAVLKYFDSIIGPYSYEKLANVQSKTRFGGMENAGNIFYYEESVDGKHQVESLVAHEIAHQWFGNSVSEENWRDIWLSEGFATYLTDMYLEHKYGKEKLRERMIMEREKVIRYSKNTNVKAIVYDEKDNLFKLLNRNSYEKGAWVLHMLRNRIGDQKFFMLLRSFFETYKNKNASTEDFIQLATSIAAEDLSTFFKQWLYRADIPIIKIDSKINKGVLEVAIQQNKEAYELVIPVRVSDKENTQIFKLSLNKTQQHFEFPLNFNPKSAKIEIDYDVQLLFQQE